VVANPEQVLGKEAKRQLQAGKPIRTYDVTDPQLVRKGQKVAIIVEKGSMTISASGKAMTGGAAGATVRVQNTASYALLEGEVAGPGLVKVTPGGR
jgi:flagella basal body P-ring formation protein FlgA